MTSREVAAILTTLGLNPNHWNTRDAARSITQTIRDLEAGDYGQTELTLVDFLETIDEHNLNDTAPVLAMNGPTPWDHMDAVWTKSGADEGEWAA